MQRTRSSSIRTPQISLCLSLSRTMATSIRSLLLLSIISSFICFASSADTAGSVFFIDGSTHRYLRPRSPHDAFESNSISLPEVGAAVSVLLGVPPLASLSAAGSSKLNEVLLPNPFNRPRAAFVVEVKGVEDASPLLESDLFGGAHRRTVLISDKSNIQLPADEVSVVSLDEDLSVDSDSVSREEINNFASWMGGSYVTDGSGPLDGELRIPLGGDADVKLYMSKKADREFVARLIALVQNIRRAIDMHEDLSHSTMKPAELIKASFDGFKVLQEYGSNSVAGQGVRLLQAVLHNIYDKLQAAYNGEIVGAIIVNNAISSDSEPLFNVVTSSQSSPRWLAEEKNPAIPSLAEIEVLLVRRTLAWITGIILLVSMLLGIYFLLYMPLTRDTLLYSSVKLD